MHSLKAYETTVGGETQVGVGTGQTRQSIEHDTIHSNEDGRGEARLGIEFYPVGVVIVGHDKLNYPLPLDYSRLYIWGTVMEVSLKEEISRQTDIRREYGRWVSKHEWSAQGTPRECIHADNSIDITKRIPSGSRSKELAENTHRRGTTRNFLSAIQANMISLMMADPTRPIHM
jgi:hypothetical protein